jgi:hypothetical protein
MLNAMHDLFQSAPFEDVSEYLLSICEKITSSKMVYLHAPSDLEGVLAISNLESACIDLGIRYSRRLLKSRQHIPHGEKQELDEKPDGLIISIEPFEDTWDSKDLKFGNVIKILPLSVSVRMGSTKNKRLGGLDAQCSAIAAHLAPNGARVRRLRPFAGSGQWLRESLDTTFDPIHSWIRDHLRDEGSVRVVALPEVVKSAEGMIPELSETMLRRLKKRWSSMDFDSRSQAISELALPALSNLVISTPRLEELFWHRLLIGGNEMDIHSQIHLIKSSWPDSEDKVKEFSGAILKGLISTGTLAE